MKFQIQHNGTFKVFIMISNDREEIVSTFNSFFHHGTIDDKTPLIWLNTDKASFHVESREGSEECSKKIIHGLAMMKLYKYVNKKLSIAKDKLNSILNYHNLTEADYDEYLCDFYKPFFYKKAKELYENLEREGYATFLNAQEKYLHEYHVRQSVLGVVLKRERRSLYKIDFVDYMN